SAKQWAGLSDVAWRNGFEVVTTRHTIDMAIPRERREGEPPPTDDPNDITQRYDGVVDTGNAAGWTNVAAALDERVKFSTGLRIDIYKRADDVAIQPRGELQLRLTPALTARVSGGNYSRPAEY